MRILGVLLLSLILMLGGFAAVPAHAASAPVNLTISAAWAKASLKVVRTGWTVEVTGTLTDTRADGDCVYVEAVLEVDDWWDPDKRTPDFCKGKGKSRSVKLSLKPDWGSKLSRLRVRACAADSFKDSCLEKIIKVPAERAAKPDLKVRVDKQMDTSLAKFMKTQKAEYAKQKEGKPTRYGLDWENDGCSGPAKKVAARWAKVFKNACIRHDFAYRNYGGQKLRTAPTDAIRKKADDKLLSDARKRCNSSYATGSRTWSECHAYAKAFHQAVRKEGGKAFYGG
ncbi:MAG: hypothetical protein IPJ61_05435 [Tessaracoccus sp.]|uniref:phospholipase A2 n=1 Tax=Tessaracoccus sp. TaxID=1971211 RepID=UPI001ED1947F|nr:phospholipase A2 [Tessaracoccus sp.]MBK7820516.1 hypothetical protein [Tessaracoccus sp.]